MASTSHDPPGGWAAAIRRQRLAHGLSLGEVATQAGVSVGFLSMLENGTGHQPGYDRLRRVTTTLGLDPQNLKTSPVRPLSADLPARLGACLAVTRKAHLAELARATSAELPDVRQSLRSLDAALSVCGMRVIDSGYEAELAPLATLGSTAAGMAAPRPSPMTNDRMTVLAIVAAHGVATRRIVDEVRGLDSADLLAALVSEGYLEASQDERSVGKPLTFHLSPRVLEEVGLETIEQMRALVGRDAPDNDRWDGKPR